MKFFPGFILFVLLPINLDSFTVELPKTSWVKFFMPSIEAMQSCSEFRDLKKREIKGNPHEYRVWLGWGGASPWDLVVFRKMDSQINGKWVIWWETEDWNYRRKVTNLVKKNYSCGRIFRCRTARYCQYQFLHEPNWIKIFDLFEKNKIFELPDSSTLPPVNFTIFDNNSIVIEVREQNRYRAFEYDDGLSSYPWPEAKKLKLGIDALWEAFRKDLGENSN